MNFQEKTGLELPWYIYEYFDACLTPAVCSAAGHPPNSPENQWPFTFGIMSKKLPKHCVSTYKHLFIVLS